MPAPFFSIILPTYNRAHLLDRALESVLAQHEQEWELLIADDGSTDGTWASLCNWGRRDDRVRSWKHTNRGQAASRNEMLKHARGMWVVFLDSDDAFLPEHLALRRAAIASNPLVGLWISPMHIVGSPYVPCRIHPGEHIHIDRCIGAGMLTIRRDALLKVGGFPNLAYAEESALVTRLLAAAVACHRLPHRTYVYHRGHADTITHNQTRAARASRPLDEPAACRESAAGKAAGLDAHPMAERAVGYIGRLSHGSATCGANVLQACCNSSLP